jgi:hypothetical protein
MSYCWSDCSWKHWLIEEQQWPTVWVAANDGCRHLSVHKQIFLNSAVLLWQVGWINCLVLAYLGDFWNFDLMFLCLVHLILFFGMVNSKSGLAD